MIFDPEKAHHGKNVFISTNNAGATFPEYLKMRFKEGGFPAVEKADIESVIGKADLKLIHSSVSPDSPRATWIGHATMLVQYRGINFLTDPHLTERPGPFLVPRRLTAAALRYEQLPRIDFILISHNHYDHLDRRTVDMVGNSVIWYVPLGLKERFVNRRIRSEKVIELDWWQSHEFGRDVEITFTPAVHWSKRAPWDANKSLWGAWSVRITDFRSFFSGDTAYDEHLFREISRRTGPCQLAFIPIGAYAPKYFMLRQHVDPAQAVKIHQDLTASYSIPIHWGSFQLTHEPFLEPPKLLSQAMESAGLPQEQFKPLKIGETFVLKTDSSEKR